MADDSSPDDENATAPDAATSEPSDGNASARHPDERDDAGMDERTRRWLIRLLVGLGIGIPVAIEGATFLGLVRKHLGGGDGATVTPTATRAGNRVGVGDELLPATARMEILSDAFVRGGGGDTWTFVVVVTVRNTGETPYELRLDTVTTDSGHTVSGGASSGIVPPGKTASVKGTWTLRAGSQPASMVVTGITHGETTSRVRESVRLADVPIEG